MFFGIRHGGKPSWRLACCLCMEGLITGLLIPVVGLVAGSACVYLIRGGIPARVHKCLLGFAAGVMTAAAIWSLLLPSLEGEAGGGIVAASAGFALGVAFLLLLDHVTPHIHGDTGEGPRSRLSRTSKLVLAVTLHHIPEGMAMGVTLAAALEESAIFPMAGALALCVGIAIQNFPEGAVVSIPLHNEGKSRTRAFTIGALTGLVQPVAAIITILVASAVLPALPYLLSFAAGAMIYVVVEELIPQTQEGFHSDLGTIGFAAGFLLMMILDTVL